LEIGYGGAATVELRSSRDEKRKMEERERERDRRRRRCEIVVRRRQ